MAASLVSEARDDRRYWHKVVSVAPLSHAGRVMGRKYTLLCTWKVDSWRRSRDDKSPGYIDDLGFGLVAVADEPVDAEGRPRGHSPVKARVRLCPACFAPGSPG